MSGYTDEAIVHHGVLDGIAEFIGKPFTPLELAYKIRSVLGAGGSGDERKQPASA
jgi:DNA-binding response OmpR family regulator